MVSSINSAGSAPAVQKTAPVASNDRAADGDYKTKGVGRSAVKDADGDYKPTTTQAQSSAPVQAALTLLKLGG